MQLLRDRYFLAVGENVKLLVPDTILVLVVSGMHYKNDLSRRPAEPMLLQVVNHRKLQAGGLLLVGCRAPARKLSQCSPGAYRLVLPRRYRGRSREDPPQLQEGSCGPQARGSGQGVNSNLRPAGVLLAGCRSFDPWDSVHLVPEVAYHHCSKVVVSFASKTLHMSSIVEQLLQQWLTWANGTYTNESSLRKMKW